MNSAARAPSPGMAGFLASISLVLLAAGTGCGSAGQPATTPATARSSATSTPDTPSPSSAPDTGPSATATPSAHPHVMLIIDENHSEQQIIGNTQLPYLNSLADRYGLATHWDDLSHPSLPNYLGLISGSIQDNPPDTTPADRTYSGPTLVDQLAHAGYSWKAYMADMPRPCDLSATFGPANYDVNHDPFAYFDSIRDNPGQCHRIVPFTQFATDLRRGTAPDFMWVSPNLIQDMHDGNYAQGDAFLRAEIPIVLASQWYKAGGIVILTFDEGETTEQVATIVISQHTAPGARLAAAGNHYGTLRAIEQTYGVPLLGGAAKASAGDLRSLF